MKRYMRHLFDHVLGMDHMRIGKETAFALTRALLDMVLDFFSNLNLYAISHKRITIMGRDVAGLLGCQSDSSLVFQGCAAQERKPHHVANWYEYRPGNHTGGWYAAEPGAPLPGTSLLGPVIVQEAKPMKTKKKRAPKGGRGAAAAAPPAKRQKTRAEQIQAAGRSRDGEF